MFLGGIGAAHVVFTVLGFDCGRVFCSAATLGKVLFVGFLLVLLSRLVGEGFSLAYQVSVLVCFLERLLCYTWSDQ